MSLSRSLEDPQWFGEERPGYIYLTFGKVGYEFNDRIGSPDLFCELAMRALEQSGQLDPETLQQCQEAFAERFRNCDMKVVES